mmetsp:Transcript_4784/g.11934  ORF Transcript_4784/g.11934 Transcript_4784/m.11934 type:complete len:219 (+) Transcript_4784:1898-2554(+)
MLRRLGGARRHRVCVFSGELETRPRRSGPADGAARANPARRAPGARSGGRPRQRHGGHRSRHPRAAERHRRGGASHGAQHHATAERSAELWGAPGHRLRRAPARHQGSGRADRPRRYQRGSHRRPPLQPLPPRRHARTGPAHPHLWRTAPEQLSVVGDGVHRAVLQRADVARLRRGGVAAGAPRVRREEPALWSSVSSACGRRQGAGRAGLRSHPAQK